MADLSTIKLKDSSGTVTNPATEESILLLRKILKVLESNATVDNKQRQKVTIEAIGTNSSPASTEINATIPVTAVGTNIGTTIAGNAVAVVPAIGAPYYQAVWEGPVDQRWRIIDAARNTFANSIRTKLSFS